MKCMDRSDLTSTCHGWYLKISRSGHCLFCNDRTWSEDGDPWSRCPSVIYVVCKLCVQCSVLPGSHKVGPQAAGHGGSHEQNVNTDHGINCELRPGDCVYSINTESELNWIDVDHVWYVGETQQGARLSYVDAVVIRWLCRALRSRFGGSVSPVDGAIENQAAVPVVTLHDQFAYMACGYAHLHVHGHGALECVE